LVLVVVELTAGFHIHCLWYFLYYWELLQGRRRQEGLVAKLLRADLDGADLERLGDAVGMAQRNNLPYADAGMEQQLQLWMEGLLDNDQVREFTLKFGMQKGSSSNCSSISTVVCSRATAVDGGLLKIDQMWQVARCAREREARQATAAFALESQQLCLERQ
jgi:hypothetical protein